jgi:hypothetical protein
MARRGAARVDAGSRFFADYSRAARVLTDMRALLFGLALAFSLPAAADPAPNPDGLDTPQSRLSDVHMAAAHKAYEVALERWKHGSARLDDVYRWSVRVRDSELEREPIARRDTDRTYSDHLKRMRDVEATVAALHRKGVASAEDVVDAAFYRAEAEFTFENKRIE